MGILELLLVSYHDKSGPFQVLACTAPSHLRSGHFQPRGAQQILGREVLAGHIRTNAGLCHLEPKQETGFQLPREVRASLEALLHALLEEAIAQPIQQQSPFTARP